jgi:hypothetical protein
MRTHLANDFERKLVDLSRQSEPRQGDGKINAFFSIIDAGVGLFKRQWW